MTGGPPIEVSPETVTCPGHGEHLRAEWPKGFAKFAMTLVQAALGSDAFIRAVDPGWTGERGTANFDAAKANAVLARRPCCYFVDRATVRRALHESGLGRIGLCRVCGRTGLGGPYSVDVIGRRVEHPHVCFECALDTGERIHLAHPDGGAW